MKTNLKVYRRTLAGAIFTLLLVLPSIVRAQDKHEKVQQLKVAYFTKELNLTTQEAEKFWPIYNEMEVKIKELRKSRRKTAKNLEQNYDSLSVDAMKKNTNALFDSEIAEVNLRREYYNKIGEAIGFKKATKVLKLEREFKQQLLQRLKEERGPGDRPPKGPRPQ